MGEKRQFFIHFKTTSKKIVYLSGMRHRSFIAEHFRRGSLDVLYDEMYRPLLLYASRCLTDQFAFLAEDCVQDAILRAYRMRESFTADPELRSYLYRAVHGKAIDILRKNRAKEHYLSSRQESEYDVMADIVESEAMNRLFRAVAALPERDRELFFNYRDGLKTSEIAARMGLSESTIKQRKAKMIAILQQSIGDETLLILLLAKLALNAEIYLDDDWTDKQYPDGKQILFSIDGKQMNAWETVIYFCDYLENRHYGLEFYYSNNFKVRNENSVENIWIIPMDKEIGRAHV